MKNFNKLAIILFTGLTIMFSSCSSDSDSNGGGGSAALGTIKAKIAGSNFTSMSQGTFATIASNGVYQNLSIAGTDITGKTIQLMILGPNLGVGTYQITEQDSDHPTTAVYSEVNLSNPTSALTFAAPYEGSGNAGSVIITSMTATNIQGTFSFTGTAESGVTKAITNGTFNVNFN